MAVQYIAVSHEQEQSTPVSAVRRSSRHIPPPTPATSSSGNSANREFPGSPVTGTPRRTKRPPNPLTTLTPTPTSRKRSRPSSDLQDETEEEQQRFSSPTKSSSRLQRKQRQVSITVPPTPEPTPRAIRAQKRRKLADEVADAVATGATSSSQPSLSTSPASPSLSSPPPQPHPVSPEPISPTNSASTSAYVIKTRAGKRKTRQFDKEGSSETGSSGSASDSNMMGDPLPRSLAKRRRIVRIATPQVSSTSSTGKSKSKSSPTATITRTRRKTPRGINTSVNGPQVRRSARLQSSSSSSQSPDTPGQPPASKPIATADPFLPDDGFSIPMSPLTPPPDDDSRPPTPEPEPGPEQPLPSPEPSILVKEPSEVPTSIEEAKPAEPESSYTETPPAPPPTQVDAESQAGDPQEDEEDMEMIASIGINRTSSTSAEVSSIPPSPAAAAKFRSVIPAHISNPVLKGRQPPNPHLYNQLQLATYARTKPNTPSPLSLYSYTGNTPPTSPALSATTALDVLDDIPSLGPSAAAAFIEADGSIFGLPIPEQYQQFDQQQVQFFEQQAQQGQYTNTSTTGYVQDGQQQPQQQSVEAQVYDHLPQQQYQQPQVQAASASEPMLDMSFMMDIHMQLMQMPSSADIVNGFQLGVDNMMATGTGSESNRVPATVNMQDVHLHQPGQPQHILEGPAPVQVQSAQYQYTGFFVQEQVQQGEGQFGTYGQSQQQYGTPVQEHSQFQPQPGQFQPQYQQEYQEQPQQQASADYEGYGAAQPQAYDASQVAQAYEQQQHFQPQQQVEVSGYDGFTGQASTAPTTVPNDAATTTSHYTLGMHNALVYFQQTLSRFHEQQQLAKQESEQAHASQLVEFQREKEEKKRRLKKTKLITRISSNSMSVYSAHRSKTLWSLACKARMWEVVRRYSSDLIREVTEFSAREYHHRMGLRYPYPRRRRRVAKVHQEDDTTDDKEACKSPVSPIDKDGLEDDDEFRKEKIFDFELLDDDEDVDGDEDEMEIDEVKKQTGGGGGDDDNDDDDGMDDDDEAYDDDDEDEDEDEDYEEDPSNPELDQAKNPDLSMQIQPQGASSPSSMLESTFYVPPLDFMPLAIPQNSSQQDQQQSPSQDQEEASTSTSNTPSPLKRKLMVVQRPVLSLPPPGLSTFRPQALKLYNIDPVHAGRGTPSIRVRRELWAGGPLPPFPVIQARPSDVDQASAGISSDDVNAASTEVANCVGETNADVFAPGCVTAYYAFASDDDTDVFTVTNANTTTTIEDTGLTPTLARQVTESSSSSADCAHPVDESAVSVVAYEAGPDAVDCDTEFGDCAGSCCLSEKAKGKQRAVEEEKEDKEKGGAVQETDGSNGGFGGSFDGPVDGTARGEGQHNGADSTSTLGLPPGESLPDTLPHSSEDQTLHQTLHQTVELTPAIPDRTPLRRRSVPGRCELLKVYAPLVKSTPPMLPLARRPPRPLPLEDNPVLRSNGQPYHPVTPYSWEQVAEAIDFLACHGIDAASWADASNISDLSTLAPTIVLSGTEIQPTFHSSSSELSAALG